MDDLICTTEYSPIVAEACMDVYDHTNSRFLIINKDTEFIRPLGHNKTIKNQSYTIYSLDHHKFWVMANTKNEDFRSASESDLANPENIIGVGCFIHERNCSKYFIFNIDSVLFYGPAIFPNGGSYLSLTKQNVLCNNMPLNDYEILQNYLNDIKNVEYWDYKKHV
jgi:hypothetical protein